MSVKDLQVLQLLHLPLSRQILDYPLEFSINMQHTKNSMVTPLGEKKTPHQTKQTTTWIPSFGKKRRTRLPTKRHHHLNNGWRRCAKKPAGVELMLVLSLSWCFFMGVTAQLPWVGVGMELAALIAGVALATFPYSAEFNGDWLKMVWKMGLEKKDAVACYKFSVFFVFFFWWGEKVTKKNLSRSVSLSVHVSVDEYIFWGQDWCGTWFWRDTRAKQVGGRNAHIGGKGPFWWKTLLRAVGPYKIPRVSVGKSLGGHRRQASRIWKVRKLSRPPKCSLFVFLGQERSNTSGTSSSPFSLRHWACKSQCLHWSLF